MRCGLWLFELSDGRVREWLPFSDWLAVCRMQLSAVTVIHVPTRGQNVLLIFFDLSLEVSAPTDSCAHHSTRTTMVQGTAKGLQSRATANNARRTHKAAANTKKGRRTVAPKKAAAIKQASMHKVSPRFFFYFLFFSTPSILSYTRLNGVMQALSAKINKSVEQQMVNAASSGKLTIMKSEGTER